MATTKIREQIQQRKKNLTVIFKHTMGIYTHIDDVVSHDKHGICEWTLLPLRVISLQIQNRKYTYQQPGNLPGLGIWHALCGLEIFWAKQ